jgi:hypothetical protein
MIHKILGEYINLSLVRQIHFDGKETVLTFDKSSSVRFPGDFREILRSLTGGVVVTAANAAGFVS